MYEKVNPCHPDKVADRIAGAIVDFAYNKVNNPKIAVEVLLGHGVCTIIVESSVSIEHEEAQRIVQRITNDKPFVRLIAVTQDHILAGNQEGEVRCGDNGIFKGMPLTQEQIAAIESAAETSLELDGEAITVTPADFIITSEDMPGWQVASEGTLTVALDVTITEELKREGVARELVNRIQNIRKEANFSVTDKIRVEIEPIEGVEEALAVWADFIGQQTLAVEVKAAAEPQGEVVVDSDLDETPLKIAVTRC